MAFDAGDAEQGTGLAGVIGQARQDTYGGDYSISADAKGLNAEAQAIVDYWSGISGFTAYRDSALSLVDSDYTTVIFTKEHYDKEDEYDNATGIFTATLGGIYLCSWMVTTDNVSWTAGDRYHTTLSINDSVADGSGWRHRLQVQVTGTHTFASGGSVAVSIADGDTLRVKAYQDTGIAINTNALGRMNFFSVNKIR